MVASVEIWCCRRGLDFAGVEEGPERDGQRRDGRQLILQTAVETPPGGGAVPNNHGSDTMLEFFEDHGSGKLVTPPQLRRMAQGGTITQVTIYDEEKDNEPLVWYMIDGAGSALCCESGEESFNVKSNSAKSSTTT